MSVLPDWVDRRAFEHDTEIDPQGRWVNSPLNRIAVPSPPAATPRRIILRDDTLRSGGNTPGVYASVDKKLRIADALAEMGIAEAEVGYGSLPDDLKFVSELRKRDTPILLGMHQLTWSPKWKADIDATADCGAHLVNFVGMQGYTSTQALHPHLQGEAFLERMEECIAYAKSKGLKVAIGTDHPSLEVIPPTVKRAVAAGADRWVIYDTRGWLLPQTMAFLVSVVRAASDDKIEISAHAHDDFGLATINTFEAIRAGASACDVTINRTGHRCGNAALEQVAVGLESFFGYDTGLDLGRITAISHLVSELYDVPVAENAPVVGHNMFSYGGLHITGILDGDWFLWENLRAETVGSARHLVYGPTSLQRGEGGPLAAKARSFKGKTPSEAQMDRIVAGIRELIEVKKFATDPEVEAIISRAMA